MTSQTITTPEVQTETAEFQSGQVAPVLVAHLSHDIYTASVAPLLPVLIEKLTLSLTQAGLLTTFLQIPGVINPFIGYIADKVSIRAFLILAPALTATFIGAIGWAQNYATLAILLFCAGISNAMLHAPAPAMIGRASGRRVGLGMSLFMAAGELAFAIGPLLAVWMVTTFTLEGFWRISVFGWAASIYIFLRLRGVSARPEKPGSLRAILPGISALFIPIALFLLLRYPLMEAMSTYLPTFMTQKGANLYLAGISLSIYMISGVAGVLLVGPLSDRFDRKLILTIIIIISSGVCLLFQQSSGLAAIILLIGLGLTTLCTNPVLLAMVQESFPNNRAMANGIFMMLSFALRPFGTITVGFMGDTIGLERALFWSAWISLLALVAIRRMPAKQPI